jgi:undecaprenyl-diphosphatase
VDILKIIILAFVQGLAELLPVSSSAHVIVAEKLMGIDPTAPEMTFLLVMLHTGTMGAVLFYFWKRWQRLFTPANRGTFIKYLFLATVATGVFGLTLKTLIEKFFMGGSSKAEIEELFGNLTLIAISLASVGLVILFTARKKESTEELSNQKAIWIGVIQGICLPFRGFSRSGATISTGMYLGVKRVLAEEFSFALAVILTPPVVLRELMRLMKAKAETNIALGSLIGPGVLGMIFSFFAGLLALRWVSAWIDKGKWSWFGYYCLAAAAAIWFLR